MNPIIQAAQQQFSPHGKLAIPEEGSYMHI